MLSWNSLSLQKRTVFSSLLVGLVYAIFYQNFGYEDTWFGLSARWLIGTVHFGFLFAWPELWKKNYRQASLQFVIGASASLGIMLIGEALPESGRSIYGIVLTVLPTMALMLLLKLTQLQGKQALTTSTILKTVAVGTFLYVSYFELPTLMFGYALADTLQPLNLALRAPLFLLFMYKLAGGRSLKEMVLPSSPSTARFLTVFLLSWAGLLLCLFNLSGTFWSRFDTYGSVDTMYIMANSVQTLQLILMILALAYLATQSLVNWHTNIQKPLGWLYLLSFVPLVNFYSLSKLVYHKEAAWSSAEKWVAYLENERTRFASAVFILSILLSVASIAFEMALNSRLTEGTLYISLIASCLTVATLYALYRGWGSFWPVAGAYLLLYAGLLAAAGDVHLGILVSAATMRLISLLIYYKAINPAANKALEQQLVAA
ncbi:hypothetical protein [Cesiribacter andamanensis]|uniref:Uncharacterized protein n=1 Tax=Cesiribacter andamanensis AMV16 TaxID=1279009 RepID=M7MW16_9BACT|nr:hypothetical protein [Cesiribacter andamanensis]EMR00638.1 hypothetical protein ADICEAN_04240 [Cesiribacter andamanensis AMV16]